MKNLLVFTLAIFLVNCSFDNKSGIWTNNNDPKFTKDVFKDFKTLNSSIEIFDKIIKPNSNLNLKPGNKKTNIFWKDEFYQNSNNLDNFSYSNLNEILFKSKKLSGNNIKPNLLFDGDNILALDEKGTIFVYSLEDQKITLKYNFYKKRFKKHKKRLSAIVDKNIIYVGDNLGYFYALNYLTGEVVWAKNFKVPFRSNIKLIGQRILISDINNFLYFIDKENGERMKFVPTEKSVFKNEFINSLSANKNTLFFLNTYGSLYSIGINGRINWFSNLNRMQDLDQINSFYSNPLVLLKNKIIVSTDPYLYILDTNNGTILFKVAFQSKTKPIVTGKNMFLITKKNLLVCVDIESGKVVYSIKIEKEISEYLKSKEKPISIKTFAILDDSIFIFLNNSYFVNFSLSGNILNIDKLPSKINSLPIFVNDSIIYLNSKNKIILVN